MKTFTVEPIGQILLYETYACLKLRPSMRRALEGLDGFSHIQALWWFDRLDTPENRKVLNMRQPYKDAPPVLGTFATRGPQRPNPIALTCVQIIKINYHEASIDIAYIDAQHKSPLLDIKPYTPSLDRVNQPSVPQWCAQWPLSVEESGNFDWAGVFNFDF